MRQVVDFKSDESISFFIQTFKGQFFDQGLSNNNIYMRKASFMGFYAIANILKSVDRLNPVILYKIIHPLVSSFKDNDAKVIVEAANTLIKILKNQNKVVLSYFNDIFEGLLNVFLFKIIY